MKIQIKVDYITGYKKGDIVDVISKEENGYIIKQTDDYFKNRGFCKLILPHQAEEQ